MKLSVVAAGMVLACVTSAHAHWQYTRWGMTPEEIAEAAPENAQITRPEEQETWPDNSLSHMLDGRYSIGERAFKVEFAFDNDMGLARVILKPLGRIDCYRLFGELSHTYGPAETEKTSYSNVSTWSDKENGNAVNYIRIGDHFCDINYSPSKKSWRFWRALIDD